MSQRIGTVVTAPMRINDDTIQSPIVFSSEIEGGAQSGATLSLRDTVAIWHRRWGMTFRVYNDGVNNGLYTLKYGLYSTNMADNQNWTIDTGGAITNVVKLDILVNGSGVINLPAGCLLNCIIVNAAGPIPDFKSGYTAATDDLVMDQSVDTGYTTWQKNIYLPGATSIYFSGINPQSVCSVIIFTF